MFALVECECAMSSRVPYVNLPPKKRMMMDRAEPVAKCLHHIKPTPTMSPICLAMTGYFGVPTTTTKGFCTNLLNSSEKLCNSLKQLNVSQLSPGFSFEETCSLDSGYSEATEPLDLSMHCHRVSSPVFSEQDDSDDTLLSQSGRSSTQPSGSSRVCPECGKRYESNSRFRAHLRRHESKHSGRYSCDVCHKNFVQRSSLKTHQRIHSGERPYQCPVCDEKFGDFSTFTKHKRIHTGEKPYECPVCFRKFSQSGNMHRHRQNLHRDVPHVQH